MAAFSLSADTNRKQRKYAFGDDRHLTMCVYAITNKSNGHQYVGVTSGKAGARWTNHALSIKGDKKACPLVSRAIAKHGIENFEFSVIDIAESREQLSHKEKFWVAELGTIAPNGYNLTTGGDANFEVADEVRAKQRLAAQSRTEEWIEKQSVARKAWWSENPEYRSIAADRARKHHTGRRQSKGQVEARASGKRGMILTHEQRITLARAHMNGMVIRCHDGNIYLSAYEAAIATGADQDKIGSVCTGKRKSTNGFRFWYEVAKS